MFTKYKPIPPEAVVASRPDILLVTNRTLYLMGGPEKFLSRPEIAATPAGRNGRIVSMEVDRAIGAPDPTRPETSHIASEEAEADDAE